MWARTAVWAPRCTLLAARLGDGGPHQAAQLDPSISRWAITWATRLRLTRLSVPQGDDATDPPILDNGDHR